MATADVVDAARNAPASVNCMDVWGGNGTTSDHVTRPGLELWLSSRSRGRTEAGGCDLHLLSSCSSGRITRMLLADICGFGSLPVTLGRQLSRLMRRNINSIAQTRFVRGMSQCLARADRHGVCASTLVGTYFAPTRSLNLCNAGHPPPLLFRAATGEWSLLKNISKCELAGDVPIGIVDPAEYQELEVKLEAGDMVLSYSNALTEGRTPGGRMLGVSGMLRMVRGLDPHDPGQLIGNLIRCIERHYAAELDTADHTVLLCQATLTRAALRDNLLAPIRLLRSARDRTRIV